MNSNTQDPFVPKLNRHKFTPQEEQPVFDFESQEAFGKYWTGYILVEEDIPNATLQIGADDNASVTLTAFPDKVAEVTPVEGAVYGGGPFRLSPAIVLTDVLRKGYYRISISYTNVKVHPDWRNVAILKVLLDGKQITVGDLQAYNSITKEKAEAILANYRPYSYPEKTTDEVYATLGGWLNEHHISGGPEYYHSCALRLSIALSASGYNLEGQEGANNALLQDNTILGGFNHVIISSASMSTYMQSEFGPSDYVDPDYQEEGAILGMDNVQAGDIIAFSDNVHSGLSKGTENLGDFQSSKTWLLYRSTWGEPLSEQ